MGRNRREYKGSIWTPDPDIKVQVGLTMFNALFFFEVPHSGMIWL